MWISVFKYCDGVNGIYISNVIDNYEYARINVEYLNKEGKWKFGNVWIEMKNTQITVEFFNSFNITSNDALLLTILVLIIIFHRKNVKIVLHFSE